MIPAGMLVKASTVTQADARRVFDTYVATSDRVLAAKNYPAALALTRDVQFQELKAQVTAATVTHGKVPTYEYGTPSFIVPDLTRFPQWFGAVVERTAPAGRTLAGVSLPAKDQVVMLFQRVGTRQPWQLAATAQLPAGQALPKLATAGDGRTPVAALDGTSFFVRPDVVGPLQASVVDDGPSSLASQQAVASGPMTTGMYAFQANPPLVYRQPRGDVRQWALQGATYNRFAVRTANGGALVFYSGFLGLTTEVPAELAQADTIPIGPLISIPPEFAPLLPAHDVPPRRELRASYTLTFAAIDPPATSAPQKIQVIAIGGGPTSISSR
jgi:hypothetical protein